METSRGVTIDNEIFQLCRKREKECIGLLEAFLDYLESDASERKKDKKKEAEEKLQNVDDLNQKIKKYYCEKKSSRCIASWYGQIFNQSVSERKQNWRIKCARMGVDATVPSYFDWYANNNNPIRFLLEELLCKDGFKKNLDYWSYNLIREMLEVEEYFEFNPEISKIFSAREGYGFDFSSAGLNATISSEEDKRFAEKVIAAILPWLYGDK